MFFAEWAYVVAAILVVYLIVKIAVLRRRIKELKHTIAVLEGVEGAGEGNERGRGRGFDAG